MINLQFLKDTQEIDPTDNNTYDAAWAFYPTWVIKGKPPIPSTNIIIHFERESFSWFSQNSGPPPAPHYNL